jgi:hypothetical protein
MTHGLGSVRRERRPGRPRATRPSGSHHPGRFPRYYKFSRPHLQYRQGRSAITIACSGSVDGVDGIKTGYIRRVGLQYRDLGASRQSFSGRRRVRRQQRRQPRRRIASTSHPHRGGCSAARRRRPAKSETKPGAKSAQQTYAVASASSVPVTLTAAKSEPKPRPAGNQDRCASYALASATSVPFALTSAKPEPKPDGGDHHRAGDLTSKSIRMPRRRQSPLGATGSRAVARPPSAPRSIHPVWSRPSGEAEARCDRLARAPTARAAATALEIAAADPARPPRRAGKPRYPPPATGTRPGAIRRLASAGTTGATGRRGSMRRRPHRSRRRQPTAPRRSHQRRHAAQRRPRRPRPRLTSAGSSRSAPFRPRARPSSA